eukprot:scaffold1548_cov232-Chaetoceros_neogracile.AAC.6
MKSIIAPPKLRILIALFAILSLNKFTEGKVRLVPKGKKNQKKQQLRKNRQSKPNGKPNGKPKGNGKAAQVILKPRRKEAANIQLQATIGKNEKGEQVLLLSEESAAAVTTAMQTSQVAQEKQQEAEPVKQTAAVKVPLEKEEEPEEQQVLFYDPAELKTAAGEIPLPKHVFDEDGNEVDMAGKEAILIPPPNNDHPPPPPPEDEETTASSSSTSSTETEESEVLSTPHTHDQTIIISTVATMALFVGALSARRLRSRQFLSFCIENESLEDELAYDAAYTTQSTVGASSFYAGAGYDTFGGSKYGGDLRWRGDLEKFDV